MTLTSKHSGKPIMTQHRTQQQKSRLSALDSRNKGIKRCLLFSVFLSGFTGFISLGWYFGFPGFGGGEYQLALKADTEYQRTRNLYYKERAEIHRFNSAVLSFWGFLSLQTGVTSIGFLLLSSRNELTRVLSERSGEGYRG